MKNYEITYQSYNPSFDPLLSLIQQDEKIKKWLHFSKQDSKFIFINHIFVGFCKIFSVDEDDLEKEIEIAILEQYRRKHLSSFILDDLCNRMFTRENACNSICLSIDKQNASSIRMAIKNGFYLSEEKTKDLRKMGDSETLIFIKENYYKQVKRTIS